MGSTRSFIFTILAMAWMIVIFSFSAKTADESSAESNAVGMLLGQLVVPDFEEWTDAEQQEFAENWDYPIRKAAHMSEYALLGALLVGACIYMVKKYKLNAIVAFGISVLYAVSDEVHQHFVPGRACKITDVGFDSAGAIIGVLVGTLVIVWWDKKSQNSQAP